VQNQIARAALVATALLFAVVLAGCVDAPEPTPTATETAAPVDNTPKINLDGTAADNKEFFDIVNNDLIAAAGALDGRAFIDNLIAAGYPRADMEVTPDHTAINGAADNIQFSIRLNGTCLIGQYGNIGYASTTAALLTTGKCLVGATRPIDW
jgi:hypothetical protein